ncbi:MAG: arylsulfatase [Gammaproteobacteria bacterium]|nr:arylsulfatase [Gammaproteobacteria bacterium]
MSHKRLCKITSSSVLLVLFIVLMGCSGEGGYIKTTAEDKFEVGKDEQRPNIVVIVADDLGMADIGAFGSEIPTPNIDALAKSGVQLTNFHTAPTCSPTRAMLLSGTDNHQAGIGAMKEFMGSSARYLLDKPGYEGYLNNRVATLPEVMADAGYETLMVGKWHLGYKEDQVPSARGFQRSFALLEGGGGHFDDFSNMPFAKKATYLENGKPATLPQNFYSSPFYTNKMAQYIDERDSTKPFLSYLAYTAPHWPLQAPDASIAKFKGKYDEGYEVLLANRVANQKKMGLIPESTNVPELPKNLKPWASLTAEEQKISARKMEIYAAMVSDLDTAIGDFVSHLKEKGLYDNTIIFFFSDNGTEQNTPESRIYRKFLPKYVEACCDNSYENMGKINSYVMYGPEWARTGSGVHRLYKGSTAQGGINTPAFVHFPKMVNAKKYDGFVSVMDLMPTMIELGNAKHPYSAGNTENNVLPMRGSSMVDMLTSKDGRVHNDDYVMGFELHGGKAIRKGHWKILLLNPPAGTGQWQLYNLANDPAEQIDLSESNPEKLEELKLAWEEYSKAVGVQAIRPLQK